MKYHRHDAYGYHPVQTDHVRGPGSQPGEYQHTPESRTKLATARRTHGATGTNLGTEKRSPTRTYRAWVQMKTRCYNPKYDRYDRYGGRGIGVCDRWRESFPAFLSDMGECPPELTLDRIDNDGNYEPGNCRWATRSQQREGLASTVSEHRRIALREAGQRIWAQRRAGLLPMPKRPSH